MHRFFLFLTILFFTENALAFQFADGASTRQLPGVKHIFYWGSHQCDLTPENGYKGQLKLTVPGFRQILLFPPTIWNGTTLLRDFSFKLEGTPVATTAYTSRLGELDAAFGQKASVGIVFHVSDLPLGEGIWGAVDILIHDPDDKKEYLPIRGNQVSNEPYLNDYFLERVSWGREDITRISDRDFFTVSEFWQTVRQQPYAEWQSYVEPRTIRASVNFQAPEQASFALSVLLSDDGEYRQMLDNLNNYKHLARPGTTISLELQTAKEYERLYKKQMTLVADNDARLLLRRSRDTHVFKIEWGSFKERLEGLYLSTFTRTDGETLPVDGPIARSTLISFTSTLESALLANPLKCWIDGESRSGLSCRLTIAGETYDMNAGEAFSDTVVAKIGSKFDANTPWQLDSFALAGVDLPPLNFTIYFMFPDSRGLAVRNEFDDLLKAALEHVPEQTVNSVLTDDEIQINFRVPTKTFLKLSLFEAGGRLVHLTEDTFQAGQHQVKVPRELMKSAGKHYIFINTPWGVSKLELDL